MHSCEDTDKNSKLKLGKNTNMKTDQACVICGGNASGLNFNAFTCTSCKAFFRRNGLKSLDEFKCVSTGNCQVTQYSRRQCTACRIHKCFQMGMMKNRIRTEEQRQHFRDLVEKTRKKKFKKKRRRQKNKTEIICLESDEDSVCIINSIDMNQIDDLYDLFNKTTKEIIPKEFIFEFDSDLTKTVNLYCTPMSCLIVFAKQLTHFHDLPIEDKVTLLKTNMKVLLPITCSLLNLILDKEIFIYHPGNYNLTDKIVYSNLLFSRLIENDNKLLLLIIILVIFSPSLLTNNTLNHTNYISIKAYKLIKIACDEYVQILWNYIMRKSLYNERKTILTFMKILTTFLHLQNITSEIYDMIDCFIEVHKLHVMIQCIL